MCDLVRFHTQTVHIASAGLVRFQNLLSCKFAAYYQLPTLFYHQGCCCYYHFSRFPKFHIARCRDCPQRELAGKPLSLAKTSTALESSWATFSAWRTPPADSCCGRRSSLPDFKIFSRLAATFCSLATCSLPRVGASPAHSWHPEDLVSAGLVLPLHWI